MMTRIYAFIGLLLLILIQSSVQIPIQENMEENSSLMSEEALFNDPREVSNMKRHSEGTFSNDYSKYLETRRAQDFVQWLMNSKRKSPPDDTQTALSPVTSALTCRTRRQKSLCPG
ncbi:glucagon-2-like isoform X2 [Carassius auratus]|uniref:Glucagon-2-like isoform X2 n=1 Tax=Carassius auratus TaxID=7957 RepID=A0A6P6KLL3_CARAU|nr:glucagon-2-like isoform X2 [Carassius auratus]XP_052463094.1 glucagon-2 isoform X2 [Carassius gibelio]